MGALQTAYATWRERPFPPGCSNDELDELHADLALADTWVADSVIPYVERGEHVPAAVDVLEELRRVRARVDQSASRLAGDLGELAMSYRNYIDVLSELYERFLAQA